VTTRLKLEIVRTEDAIDVWLGGKIVSQHIGHLAKLEAVEEAARDIAAVLGADVVHTDEPSRQPYTYFISNFGIEAGTREARPGNCWMKRSTDIESGADTDEIAESIKADLNGRVEPLRRVSHVIVTGFTCTDGPY
jgi:hypothetical protein